MGLERVDGRGRDAGEEAYSAWTGDMVLDPRSRSAIAGRCNCRHKALGIHVADVEQAALLSSPVVRIYYAQVAILDRHRIATKLHHLAAMLDMQVVQWSLR